MRWERVCARSPQVTTTWSGKHRPLGTLAPTPSTEARQSRPELSSASLMAASVGNAEDISARDESELAESID
jgi:hypothetical protein